jgi:hypothetical protein
MTNDESRQFTTEDIRGFLDEVREHERLSLVDRLRRASERLVSLTERVTAGPPSPGSEWTAHEVLAHITAVSAFWSRIIYKVAKGETAGLDLLPALRLRDLVGARLARREPAQLVRQARQDLAHLIDFLKTAPPETMRRTLQADEKELLTAEDLARLAVINHVELHLDQLEAALSR